MNSPLTQLLAKRRGKKPHSTTPITTPVHNIFTVEPSSTSNSLRSHLMNELRSELSVTTRATTPPTTPTHTFKSNQHHRHEHSHSPKTSKDIDLHVQIQFETKRADDAVLQVQTLRTQATTLHDNIAQMRLAAVELLNKVETSFAEKHARGMEIVREQTFAQVAAVQEQLQREKQTHQQINAALTKTMLQMMQDTRKIHETDIQVLEEEAREEKIRREQITQDNVDKQSELQRLQLQLQSNQEQMKAFTNQREIQVRAKLEAAKQKVIAAEERAMKLEKKCSVASAEMQSLESILQEKVVQGRVLKNQLEAAGKIQKKQAADLLLSNVKVDIVRQETEARIRIIENQIVTKQEVWKEERLLLKGRLESTVARATITEKSRKERLQRLVAV